MNVPGPMVITQSTVSLVNHMYVSTYQLMGAKGCGGYTHAMLPRISVGYMAQYNLAYENSSSKVRDTIEEVNVNGFLMNNITFMPTIPQCVEIYQLCWL